MTTTPTCEVCKNVHHKYKCPTCLLKYCSVACFKDHKASTCSRHTEDISSNKPQLLPAPPAVKENFPEAEEGELLESDVEESEDKVARERLERLGECCELKSLLENPHLRKMLQHVDSSRVPSKDIHKAMLEPIFTEFADCCLKVVKPERYTQET